MAVLGGWDFKEVIKVNEVIWVSPDSTGLCPCKMRKTPQGIPCKEKRPCKDTKRTGCLPEKRRSLCRNQAC
jgi:hypothetical protein